MFKKTIRIQTVYEPIDTDTLSQCYDLYKYYQDEDSSRGLLTRNMTFNEFIKFSLRVNPMTQYDKFYDTTKLDKQINKKLEQIPRLRQTQFQQLWFSEEFYDKIYAFNIDYGLSIEKLILYNVFLLLKTKNPHYTQYNIEHWKHEQPTWIEPPTQKPPLTETEENLIQINHILRRINYEMEEIEGIKETYGVEYTGQEGRVIQKLDDIKKILDKIMEINNTKFRKIGLDSDTQNKKYDKTQRFYNPLYDSSNNNSKIITR